MLVFDARERDRPKEVARVQTPDFALSLALNGSYLAVGAARGGVLVFDVGGLPDVRLVSSIDTPGLAADVVFDSGRIFVADCSGLVILGGEDPVKLRIVGRLEVKEGAVKGVAVSGGIAVLAGDGWRSPISRRGSMSWE